MTNIKNMTDAELVEAVARLFHDTYERLSKDYGYETRQETRTFDPESANGQLMMATVRTILPDIEACLSAERGKK